MATLMRTVSIAAAGNNANLFSGSAFEWMRARAVLSMGVAQSATGMFATYNVGPQVVAEEFEPPIATVYPTIPDNFYFQAGANPGDRVVLAMRNPTAGALTARAVLMIAEM